MDYEEGAVVQDIDRIPGKAYPERFNREGKMKYEVQTYIIISIMDMIPATKSRTIYLVKEYFAIPF